MAHEDQKAASAGFNVAATAMECAVSAVNAASRNMQAVAGECFEISKESFEHATQAWEKLRSARGMDEIMTIQTNYVKEVLENATHHARKFGEIIAAFPAEMTKTYQDAWLKAADAGRQAMESAGKTASESAHTYSEAVRTPTAVYEQRAS